MLEVMKNKVFETRKIMDYEEEQSLQITSDLIGENNVTWGELADIYYKTGSELLEAFEQVPIDEASETLKTNFYAFEKGTEKSEVYAWFEWAFEVAA